MAPNASLASDFRFTKVRQRLQAPLRLSDKRIFGIPGVACQDRADHFAHAGGLVGEKEYILEEAVVPELNKHPEGFYAGAQRLLILGVPVHRFALQLAIQQCHANTGRAHGDGYARGEYRIKKLADRKSTRLNSSHVAISYAVF